MFQKLRNIVLSTVALAATYSCGNDHNFSEPLPETVDFNFHVRPILVQNCYLCHGPDPSGRKAELRLDIYEGATAALKEGGHAIVPGKPSKSQLIYRIYHEEEDQVMPPPESNYKLTEREKALLEKWVDQGAEWKAHWAFIKPETSISATNTNAIDSLIDMQLEQKQLAKSPEANKNSLIRRVSYLLTGLPPSPSDVQYFISDDSPEAYEKMVDGYLNSSAYGERWARHWMDLVRYAETKGHEFDYEIVGAWHYRDYLIRAFNEDVPYDELVKEHIAGDLLDSMRYNDELGIAESQLGTAFFTMAEGTHSPVDLKKDEADRIDNIIDVTSKTFQGLTVSCARCHDHKFDPILTADYYSMYGMMESTRFTLVIAEQSIETKKSAKEIEDIKTYMRKMISEKWDEKIIADNMPSEKRVSSGTTYHMIGDFGNKDLDGWKSIGTAFGQRTTLGDPIIDRSSGRLIKLDEGRASSKLFSTGIFGSLQSQNFLLEKDFIGVRARGKNSTIRIVIDNFQLIQDPIYGELEMKVDNEQWGNFIVDVSPWKGHKAYIEILPGEYQRHKYQLPEDAYVEAKYALAYNSEWPSEVQDQNESFKKIQQRNAQLKNGNLTSQFPELKSAVDSSLLIAKNLASQSIFYGVADGFGIDSPVFIRGNHQELSEEKVPRSFLSALPKGGVPFKSKGSGRMEFAEAVLANENPLTARVMVNRIWHHLFGRGIVETVDNFGLQGKLPSHPELLDYLAIKFQNENWSIKKMVRSIVMTEAFKRSTSRRDELLESDPTNIYLASFPIRRLEAEAIRDGILVASESLNDSLYGPPVHTYLTDFMQGRGRPSKSGPLNGNARRSIYLEVRRNFLEPMMTTFDRPIPFSTFGKRDVTNVPSQSLIIMNDPFVARQAEIMAQKLLSIENLSFDEKVSWIYMRSFARNPTAEELTKAKEFMAMLQNLETSSKYESHKELEHWKQYCHSIFNLKEFIYLI
ncbi:PSD1 and planctomycete cytochrome C domain-containing protein [Maribacter halichondriae]|uniref:PSD1 and planctomycete cytochrome C domain-containing protein n=1 Tax=Maribacter halichondriae TaxID=2980554 RepID=UPI00235A3211|nr:PSD1 and planctomycete cytochrome C domain-containing protein [Maribacter sp. Hal144]